MGKAVRCDGTHVDGCRARRWSMSRQKSRGRSVWDEARESGNCSCGGIVCDVCRSKSEVVVLVFDARQGSLLKDSPGLSVPGHTQSHEDGRAAGSTGGIWGARGVVLVPVLVLIAEGGQWWAPRSFLEMEIFAFLMFSTLARRDRPTKPTLSRSLNFAAALAWFAAASSFGLGGASKRAKRRVSRCTRDLSTSNRTDRAEHGQNHRSLEVQSSMPIIHPQLRPIIHLSTTPRPI